MQVGFFARLIGVISFCVGIYLSIRDLTSSAITCFSAGILILALFSIDKFEFVKGFGFEAKSKVLNRKIEEADELMANLVRVAKIFSHLSTQLMSRIGRMSGPIPKRETEDLTGEVLNILMDLKVDSREISDLMRPIHDMNLFDLSHYCYLEFKKFVYEKNQVCSAEIKELVKNNCGHVGSLDTVPRYSELNSKLTALTSYVSQVDKDFSTVNCYDFSNLFTRWVRGLPLFSDGEKDEFLRKVEEDLEEVAYYADNKKFKNIDKWFSRPHGH